MAGEQLTIAAVLEGKNLLSPVLSTVQRDLQATQGTLGTAGKAGEAAGKQIDAGMKQAAGGIQNVAQGAAQGLGVALPLGIAAATAAVVGFGVSSLKSFGEFDTQVRGATTLLNQTGATAQQSFQQMSAGVRELAVRMGVDAVDAAKGLYQTISAGVPAGKAAFDVLEVASKAAVGGMTDTSTAVDGLTTVLNAFGLEAKDAGAISDQMFQTVNVGKITFAQLSKEVGQVAPIAHAAGLEFKDVGGFIANATQQGISAGEAVASLRQILQAFIRPSAEAQDVARLLGIQFNEATLKSRGLQGALDYVAAAAKGDKEAMAILFGDVNAVNGVFASTGQNAGKLSAAMDTVEQSTGAADAAFATMNEGVERNGERMLAKFNDLKLSLGEKLLPVANDFLTWVDLVGQKLGAWPATPPPPEQIERFNQLSKDADSAAAAIGGVVKVLTFLNGIAPTKNIDHIFPRLEDFEQGGLLGPIIKAIDDAAHHTEQAAAATAELSAAEKQVTDAYLKGNITVEEATRRFEELRNARTAQTAAEAAGETQTLQDAAAIIARVDAQDQAAKAERDAAAATAQAAAAATQSSAQQQQSIRDRLAAQKEADAAAKQAADQAKREAAQHAADVAKANATVAEDERKLYRDLAQTVADGEAQLQDIRDRHDRDYNQAIVDAQAEQRGIYEKAADDRAKVEQDAGERVLDIQGRIADLQAGQDDASLDRRLRLARDAQDQEIADAQRAADRKLRDDRAAQDDALRQQERAQDRALESQQRAAERAQEIAAAAAARKEAAERATDEGADAQQRFDKDAVDAKRQQERDAAEETTRHARELRDEETRHERALRDATTDREKRDENERHGDALQKEQERHDDATAKIAERAADDQRDRDEALADAKEKTEEQYTDAVAKIDDQLKKRLEALDAEEKAQKEADDRQAKRDEAHARVARDRQIQDERAADQRAAQARALQQAREAEDFATRQRKALEQYNGDLAKIEAKKTKDLAAIDARTVADINASNDALIAKQAKIDEARAEDFRKFAQDVADRMREVRDRFGDAMKGLESLIPNRVAQAIGNVGKQTADAGARLNEGATVPSGPSAPQGPPPSQQEPSVPSSGGQQESAPPPPPEPDPDTIYDHEEADDLGNGYAQNYHVYRSGRREKAGDPYLIGGGAGEGAGAAPSGGMGTEQPAAFDEIDYSDILDRYRTSLQQINARFQQALVGGDSGFAATGPKKVTVPLPTSAGSESALAWARQQLGSQQWDGYCEQFVENAFGTTGRYASAYTASQALMTAPGGSLADAPRGAVVFFRRDASNGNFGHVGIATGGGEFISATNSGVTIAGPTRYWAGLYAGYGAPRFAAGGVMTGMEGAEGTAVLHGGEVVFNPAQMTVLGRVIAAAGGAGGGGIDYDRLARTLANELARLRLAVSVTDVHLGLLQQRRRGGPLGLD